VADLFGQQTVVTQPRDAAPLGEYRERGAYFTPDMLALRICERLASRGIAPARILEPGCGGGAFLRGAHATWPAAQLLGVDLVPECTGPGIVRTQDFFDDAIPIGAFDLVLGNPPFDLAERFIRRALALVPDGGHVAMLLRMALAAGRREGLHEQFPLLRLDPVTPRPSFTGGGTDKGQEYALLCWKKGWKGEFTGKHLVWKEPRR
jgi:hypothetical protein